MLDFVHSLLRRVYISAGVSQISAIIRRIPWLAPVSFWILLFVLMSACSNRSDKFDLGKPVATWNGISIKADHFIKEYELFGTYSPVRDEPETRQFYAKVMLERQIIVETGKMAMLDTLPIVQETIRRRKEMAMRRHYLNMRVRPTVAPVTDEDIWTAFRRTNTRINTQQIFAKSRDEADSLLALVRNGANFDQIAEESMLRAGMRPGTGGYMGWITFNQMDEGPENALFLLQQGQISDPVPSMRGYHIFKAHDVEETVFFDQTTFQNIRDRLRHQVFHRRFDEASARFIRDEVMTQELAVDMQALYQAYTELLPSLPQQNRPEEVIRFNREVTFLIPELDKSTPLAYVNGNPFTYGQFLYQLPDIPVEWLTSDFRHALEIAIRDSILAARSLSVRPDTSRDVRLQTQMAEYSALYYATLQAGIDTLRLEPLKRTYYDVWKNEQFIDFHTTTYLEYNFRDSSTAINAIFRFKENQDWQKTLSELPEGAFTVQEKTATTKDDLNVPVHSIPLNDPDSPATIVGPFKRANWSVFKATSRETTWIPFHEVEDRVLDLLSDRRVAVVHREMLPDNFRHEDIIIDAELLDRLIPYYY